MRPLRLELGSLALDLCRPALEISSVMVVLRSPKDGGAVVTSRRSFVRLARLFEGA